MRKGILGCVVVLSCGALLASGCAKKEMVKSEEPMPAVKAAPAQPAPEKAAPAPVEAAPQAAPMPESQAQEAPVQQQEVAKEEQAEQAELQTIHFDFDSSALSQTARDLLAKNGDIMKKDADTKVRIEGNCDERGSDDYNLALGERRAKSAKDYLVTLGVPAERLTTISYGKEKPVDPGHDEAAWAKNRRDDFVVIK